MSSRRQADAGGLRPFRFVAAGVRCEVAAGPGALGALGPALPRIAPGRWLVVSSAPVLALQGAFREHIMTLEALGVAAEAVRVPEQLDGCAALIIPGGESTAIAKLMESYGFYEPIRERHREGMAVWGTCAGAILIAQRVVDGIPGQRSLELMDVEVRRNAYGRQVDSREADVSGEVFGTEPFHAVFIRAPQILDTGPGVEPLARYRGQVVLARQNNILVATFHPELTDDTRVHKLFLQLFDRKAR